MKSTSRGRSGSPLLWLLLSLQALLATRVLLRLLRTAGGEPLAPVADELPEGERLAVIVPVLNERERLGPCLQGLMAQGPEVAEIIVVDGGSCDGTPSLVCAAARRDARIRLLDAAPVPADWNGKAWGLEAGLRAISSPVRWILTIDADVRPAAALVRALLARALRDRLEALSVATLQELSAAPLLALLHPSLLATLIYRFGSPGRLFRRVEEVQANGQCFLLRRAVLEESGGFAAVRHSLCEDVTLARLLVSAGARVSFIESGGLVSVSMYASAREAWQNWTRSLPMHDQFAGLRTLSGWLEVALVQALPLPFCLLLLSRVRRSAPGSPGRLLLALNALLSLLRLGVLAGLARAYRRRSWFYWLSPLCDLAVALQLARKALQRQHIWRGRVIVRRRAPAPGGL